MSALFTIPPGLSFVDELARGIVERYGRDPLALAEVTVLLPTRRACRTLRDAFLRLSEGRPLLLPTLNPLGDLDLEGVSLSLEELPVLAGTLDLPPAIDDLRRRLLLTRAILQASPLSSSPPQAVRLAADLTRLLDQVETERLGFERLATLVPADYAQHWQITLTFLTLLTDHWPAILEAEGATDAAKRRNRVLEAQAALWRERPPITPILAAGSTGSLPATAELLQVIATLPQGALILPGLDQTLDPATWQAVGEAETHPQHTLFRLLERLGVARDQVRPWRSEGAKEGPRAARTRLLAEVLRPAATTEEWRQLPGVDEMALDGAALDGLSRIDCPTAQDEAEVVALLLRDALETPERTAALVTPDRTLARRTATALTRWRIVVDDSGGQPLADTALGSFFQLTAAVLVEEMAPVPLLALLKHPLTGLGTRLAACRTFARALERAILRGPRPGPGIAGLLAALADTPEKNLPEQYRDPGLPADAAQHDAAAREAGREALRRGVLRLGAAATPFWSLLRAGEAPFAELVRAHIRFAETLAATTETPEETTKPRAPNIQGVQSTQSIQDAQGVQGARNVQGVQGETGAERLWRGDDGEAGAAFVNDLLLAAADFPSVRVHDYPGLFEALMTGRVVRPRFGRHPRLAILGPLEARLHHYDLMILGGLNEGTWPAEPTADPWLSRPMRRAFGLPAPERQIGLSAHDFAQAAASPQVVLTRAARVDGTPTVPSRWLSRLDTVLRALGRNQGLERTGHHWLNWVRALDEPESVRPVAPPEPRPPVAARPRRLSVTAIETWMRNPYAIYARHVLNLTPLEPIAADPGAAERGQFIHKALDAFLSTLPNTPLLPPDALERLLDHGRQAFGAQLARPEVWAFWWPRFERIARWFVDTERLRRPEKRPLATEISGSLEFDGRTLPFRLTAKADRIDRLADGRLMIIDYKTGLVPRELEVGAGLAPQLPLEAAIAAAGGFNGIPPTPIGALAFWKLSGGDPPGVITELRGTPAALAEQAHGGLEALIWAFDDPNTPYRARPRPQHAPRFDDYAHLARVLEWSAGNGGEE